jgi:hypothetical protein
MHHCAESSDIEGQKSDYSRAKVYLECWETIWRVERGHQSLSEVIRTHEKDWILCPSVPRQETTEIANDVFKEASIGVLA